MGTSACTFVRSKFLCYTHYDSHPFKLGEALNHVRTNWKDILQTCKEHRILDVEARYWAEDPRFVYDCIAKESQESYPELLNSQLVEQFKNGNKEIIDERFEEILVDWPNEPYTRYFNMTDDYQYNHYDDQVFIRLRFTNFPWVPIDDLGPYHDDERILENILYDMLGVIESSEITKDLMSMVKKNGAIATGRHFILACKKTTELMPEDPNNWWNYGKSLELQGRLDEAIRMYSKAAELTPTNPIIWRILGENYINQDKTLEATNCFKKAISYLENMDRYLFINKLEREISVIEGNLMKFANPEEIKDILYKSLISIYTKLNKWVKVGWAFFKLDKTDEAINSFKKSLNEIFDSDFIGPIEYKLGTFKKYLKEISFREYNPICKIIVEHLKEKLDTHPRDPTLWRLIAENLLDCGSEQELLETFQTCMNNLEDIYNKKVQDDEKQALIKLFHNTKFAHLIPQVEKIQLKKRKELFMSFDGPRYIETVKFSPDSKYIVVGGKDKKINIWNIDTGDLYKTLEATQQNQVTFSTDGKFLSVSDEKIQIWDVGKGQIAFVLNEHKKGSIATAFTPDGKFLISVSKYDRTIKFWNLFQKKVLWNHIIESKYSLGDFNFEITPDGKNAIYTHENKIITLDINDGQIIRQYSGGWPMTVSPSGQYIAFPYDETTLFIADIKTGKPIKILQGHSFELWSLKFSSKGDLLIGGESSKFKRGCLIYIWNVTTGKLIKTLEGHNDSVRALDSSRNGRYIASGSWDKKVNIWTIS